MTRLATPTIIILTALVLSIAPWAATPSVAADDKSVDMNSIIQSLAPLKYLPQHSGTKRRAIDLNITFKTGSADLTKAARRQLDIVIDALHRRELQDQRFQVVGHTDASGGAVQNLALSKRRAAAVRSYLIKRGAISPKRLVSSGRGEEMLKNALLPNSADNRRVEFILIPAKKPGLTTKSKSGMEKVIKW